MNEDFVKAYNAEFKRNPDFFSVGGYDGMHVIYAALAKTKGKADGDSLIAAAKGMKWESPRGPMSIDPETRDIVQNVYIRKVEKVGGKLVNVEIAKFDEREEPEIKRRREIALLIRRGGPDRANRPSFWPAAACSSRLADRSIGAIRPCSLPFSAFCSTASPTGCCCSCCRSDSR